MSRQTKLEMSRQTKLGDVTTDKVRDKIQVGYGMGVTQKVWGDTTDKVICVTTDKVRIVPSDQDRDVRTFTKNTHFKQFYEVTRQITAAVIMIFRSKISSKSLQN